MRLGMRRPFAALVSASAALCVLPASAHHSLSMYDRQQELRIAGTVRAFEWVNPHVWIRIMVEKPGASAQPVFEEWGFEGGSPGRMSNTGWSAEAIKPGDKITVAYNPHRDGSSGGLFLSVTLASGVTLQGFGRRTYPRAF